MAQDAQSPRYSVHPKVVAAQRAIARMRTATGCSLEEWVEVLAREGPDDGEQRTGWLRSEHGLGSNYARLIVDRADGRNLDRIDTGAYLTAATGWVDAMFNRRNARLRPLFDHIVHAFKLLGPDVKVSPWPRLVQVYRRRQFAQLRVASPGRLEVGLALGSAPVVHGLRERRARTEKDRITHRVRLQSAEQIGADLRKWIQAAYDAAG